MASGLLGYWPGEWNPSTLPNPNSTTMAEHGQMEQVPVAPYINTKGAKQCPASGEASRPLSENDSHYSASSSSQNHSKLVAGGPKNPSRSPLPSVADPSDTDDSDWLTFQPPVELLYALPETSMEIESILEASVEKLQDRLVEEDRIRLRDKSVNWRAKAKDKGKEPAILGGDKDKRANQKSNNAIASTSDMEDNWEHSVRSKSRISGTSNLTASSADSGYVSSFGDGSTLRSIIGKGISIGSIFRRSREMPRQGTRSMTLKECVSCMDDFESKELVPLDCHSFCKSCFQKLIEHAIASETNWPPKCCLNEIPSNVIQSHVQSKIHKKYREVLEERSIPAGERVYCSKPACGAWIPPSNIKKATLCAACPSCQTKSCTTCRGAYHSNAECSQDPNVRATLQLAIDEGWRRCYNCKVMVEHNQGCIHMTCKCKAQFCYICGLKWRSCQCTEGQLRVAADRRRREAEAAEQATRAEAEELRQILQSIEEYETKEATRLAREEKEMRLIIQESRERREEARVMAVSKRYFELGQELELLHTVQRVEITEKYEKELEAVRNDTLSRETMVARHVAELQAVDAEGKKKIQESESHFDKDYQDRLAKEREIEDDYNRKLVAYWSSRPGGEVKITEAKETLRNTHTVAYRQWEAIRRTGHQRVVQAAKDELGRARGRHEEELAALRDLRYAAEARVERAQRAAYQWLEAVSATRAEMMALMEEEAYNRDDD